ncbi:MAG: DUF4147 domain-containing protein [Gammaproteobacteria bacterium]|nr:DUF4147 domain-containing protein [Gammaproteobacteria bacterium]
MVFTGGSADQAPRSLLLELWQAALAAADPAQSIRANLPPPPPGRTAVIAVGKAAARMAEVVERCWPAPLHGLVVIPPGLECKAAALEVHVASHPVPDERSMAAAAAAMRLAEALGPDDLLLCLLSGGGSSLLALPAQGLELADKRAVTAALLASGAPIEEINCIRKHLSAIKGGRLAEAAHPARVVTLAVSDVVGDSPQVIASGPTVTDATTRAQAAEILERYSITVSPAVRAWLASSSAETPKPGDPAFATDDYRLVMRPAHVLAQVAQVARAHDIDVCNLGDAWTGEVGRVADEMLHRARAELAEVQRTGRARLLLSGGELTVNLAGAAPGVAGGPNAEFVLAFAVASRGQAGLHVLAADTDGIDGTGPHAGALWTPALWEHAQTQGVDLAQRLAIHDSHGALVALDAALVCGPTGTNVNDFRAILVWPHAA